jgi:catecholate siderophore receptor
MNYIRSRKHAVTTVLAPLGAGAVSLMLAASPATAADAPATAADAAAPAPAADQSTGLVTSVTVTAKKSKVESENIKATAPLVDRPQTVQVIGSELMQERGATTLTEALQNSAGVGTFYLGENGTTSTGDAIYMRGSDVSGSILIDGVRNVGSVFRDVFNIEQVEVIKGGAGSDIGRGAATGAINMFTKHPKLTEIRSASIGYGSADYKRATADVNFVLGDSTAFRLNLVAQDAGVPGRDVVDNKRWGVAPSLGFGLGTPTRLSVDYMHIKQNNTPDGGVLTIGLPGYTSPDPVNRPYLTNAAKVDSSNFYGTNDDHDDVRVDTASFVAEHDISENITIRNLTRWTSIYQNYQLSSFMAATAGFVTPNANDPSTWTMTRNINNKDVTNDALYNGTNVRAEFNTGSIKHTVTGGLELIRERQKTRTFATAGAYTPVNIYNPSPNATGYTRSLSGAYTVGQTDTVGFYLNDNIALTDAFLFNGGLRLDDYRTTYDSFTAANVKTGLEAKDHVLSGNAGLVWKPNEKASVYVSYAVTNQPPGGANFSLSATNTANANNPDVEPQEAKNYEIGTKWSVLNERLFLTAALYKTTYSDQILQDTDGTYYRAGEKRVQGVELTAAGQITPAWSINAGYTVMDTKVASPTGAVGTADGTAVLAYNPKDSATLWTSYKFPFGLTLGGGAQYSGDMKRGSDGAVGTPKYANGYVVFNGLAAYRLRQGVELQLNVNNLFDKDYVASINKSGYRYTPGVPRSAKLALNVSF